MESERESIASRLVPQLSDPNQLSALDALCGEEEKRASTLRSVIQTFRSQCLSCPRKHSLAYLDRALFTCAKLLRLADGVLMEEDLLPLPSSGDKTPEEMSLKRLRKQLRKLDPEGTAGEDVSQLAKALRKRTWPGLRVDGFELPAVPAWAPPYEPDGVSYDFTVPPPTGTVAPTASPVAAAKGGAKAAAPSPSPAKGTPAAKGKAAAAAPVDTPDFKPGESAGVVTLYTAATRKCVTARDACYAEFKADFDGAVAQLAAAFDADWAAAEKWARSWSINVAKLRH